MKNFKLSMLAMLSGVAMTFTSCLGDGDNTQYVMGTGTVSSSSAVLLDNGLTLKSSAWSNTQLGDRVYVYASVPGEEYEAAVAELQTNKRASVNLENIYQAGVCVDGEYEEPVNDDFDAALAEETTSEIESLSWLSYGSFGNGYMNFSIKADWYSKTENNSTTNGKTDITLMLKEFDASAKTLELVVIFNNHKALYVDQDGKLKDGCKLVSGYEIPVSVDVEDLYSEMISEGLADEDKVSLSVKYVKNEDREISADELTGTFGTGTNYCTVSMFKRSVY